MPSRRRTPSLDDVVRAARDGHDGARRVLDDAGHMLGLGTSYLVSILNPELVVVGGEAADAFEFLLDPLRGATRAGRAGGRAGAGRRQRGRRRCRGRGRGAARVRSRGGERGGGRVTLVAGIDSSTQSCKVEVRDADTGELVRTGQRPAPPHRAAPQRAGSGRVVGGVDVAARRARSRRRGDLGGRPAARHGRARRRAPGAPAGEALERHRVGAAGRRAGTGVGRAGVGRRGRHGAGGVVHGDEARVAARARARACSHAWRTCCSPTTG